MNNGCFIEGFWNNNKLIGQFIMIKPNGSSFIGKNVDGKLQGFVYKFNSIYERMINESLQDTKDFQEETMSDTGKSDALKGGCVYKEENDIRGTGFESEYNGAKRSVYYGKFSKSKLKRQKAR